MQLGGLAYGTVWAGWRDVGEVLALSEPSALAINLKRPKHDKHPKP